MGRRGRGGREKRKEKKVVVVVVVVVRAAHGTERDSLMREVQSRLAHVRYWKDHININHSENCVVASSFLNCEIGSSSSLSETGCFRGSAFFALDVVFHFCACGGVSATGSVNVSVTGGEKDGTVTKETMKT